MPELLQSAAPWQLVLSVFGFLLTLTLVCTGAGFLAERLLVQRRIFAVPLAKGQYRFELLGNLVFLLVTTTAVSAALWARVVRLGSETWTRRLITFFVLMLGFQIYYWFLHRLLHKKALIRLHAWHHRSHVTTPLTGQSMSFGEACGWMLGYVGIPWLLSLVWPVSFGGWAGYLAFNIMGNIVGHANVELTAAMPVSRMTALVSNAFVYHALHHARWRGNYAFQAAIMDRIFGTEFTDWPVLYARIRSGQALKSLKETGTP